jgi:hypothetical protein
LPYHILKTIAVEVMKIFNKILGYKDKYNLKKKLVEIEIQIDHTYKPVKDICLSIIQAAENCKLILKTDLNFENKKDKDLAEMLVFYEYLYFFMHLTLKLAVGKFTETQMKKLREYMGPLIVGTAIDSYTKQWPEDLKEGIKREFYDKLNKAELEYSECKVILDRDKPFSDNALFTKLAKNITELTGHNNNPVKIVEIILTSIEEYAKMDLNKLVDEAANAL